MDDQLMIFGSNFFQLQVFRKNGGRFLSLKNRKNRKSKTLFDTIGFFRIRGLLRVPWYSHGAR